MGEALDIKQATPFIGNCDVIAGDYADAAGSQAVIITSGIGRKPGQTRIDLAQTNVNIIKDVAANVVHLAPEAIYVIVSNPVDILTYVFTKVSGLPENQIIGSGTILDTSRLQSDLAKRFYISPKNIHAHVYGEHGDSSFVPWSLATIANNHIDHYKESVPYDTTINWDRNYEEMEEFVSPDEAMMDKLIQIVRTRFGDAEEDDEEEEDDDDKVVVTKISAKKTSKKAPKTTDKKTAKVATKKAITSEKAPSKLKVFFARKGDTNENILTIFRDTKIIGAIIGERMWDVSRAIDLLSCFPECDQEKIMIKLKKSLC